VQRVISLRFARLVFTEHGAVSEFNDGSSWGAHPHDEPHYHHLAFAYGHEGDVFAYCQHHELAHHVVAEGFGSHSLVLWALAHGEKPTPMIAAAEESLAMNLHRYAMTGEPPFVDGVDWQALRARFIELAHG
jgi:hypothetical protein